MLKYFLLYYGYIKNYLHYNIAKYLLFIETTGHRKVFYKNSVNNKKDNDSVVIFGSGKILQNLTPIEKKKIAKSKIIFMNKNLIFWEYLNLWPDYYFLADTPIKSKVSKKIFKDTLLTISSSKFISPILILEKFYSFSTPKGLTSFFFSL